MGFVQRKFDFLLILIIFWLMLNVNGAYVNCLTFNCPAVNCLGVNGNLLMALCVFHL